MSDDQKAFLAAGVGELGLTVRAANCLRAEDIETVGDLVGMSDYELLQIPNLGKHTLREIQVALDNHGLQLAPWRGRDWAWGSEKKLRARIAELEAERDRLRKALQAIRDSTHQTALMLRAIANRELSSAKEGE